MATPNTEFVGIPDVRVILRKKQFQWNLPANQQFDVNIAEFVNGFNSVSIRNDNIGFDPDLGVAMVNPLFKNRNNFVENIAGSAQRFKVDVPRGAPPESENEINRRVWVARPTVNQNPGGSSSGGNGGSSSGGGGGQFKKDDQEFAEPGATEDLSGNVVDNRYSGPIWAEEFHESNDTGDPTVKRSPPVSWVHQKNANPNTEFFLTQKFGMFTNESFWVDVRKFRSETPANIPETELDAPDNRFNRYKSDEPLLNFIAFRIGADTEEDAQNPKGFDVVFPIDGTPFIYDHQGTGLEEDPDEPKQINQFQHRGFIASKKNNDTSWTLRNDIDSFRLIFWVIRGKLIIRSSFANSAWYFPTDLSTVPFAKTQERYSNFHVPAGKVSVLGRGLKFRFNLNPMEFNIYENGFEKQPHARAVFGPFPVRKKFTTGGDGGWVDFSDQSDNKNQSEQNYTIIPFDKATIDVDGNEITHAFGFDFVHDNYDSVTGQNYTSMMIGVDPKSLYSIQKIVKTDMRPPTREESQVIAPTGGPEGLEVTGQNAPIFLNQMLEVELNCASPQKGQNVNGGSDEFTGKIHRRFASPLLWRLKGRMFIPPLPAPEEFDITSFVTKVSYSTSAPDLQSIEQSYTVDVRIPKDYEFITPTAPYIDHSAVSGISSRQELLDLIYDGTREVEISLGYWGGDRYRDPALDSPALGSAFWGPLTTSGVGKTNRSLRIVFTGLAKGGPIRETYGNDIVSLKCIDKMEILKAFPIMNSPIFDGMTLTKAYREIGTISGLPKSLFGVRSGIADQRLLPMGFTFQEPKMKFPTNTTIYEALRKITQIFWHVLATTPLGEYELRDLYDADPSNTRDITGLDAIDSLPLSDSNFVFHVDGFTNRETNPSGFGGPSGIGPFNRCYEVFNFDKGMMDQATQIQILSVERTDGSFIVSGEAQDVNAIENPNAKNYVGYHKPIRVQQPAFGEEKYVRLFQQKYAQHVFQSPLRVNFTTFGRPTLRPLDIIDVVHQDPKTILINSGGSLVETTRNTVRYRVMRVQGDVTYESDKWQYKMQVEAEHI